MLDMVPMIVLPMNVRGRVCDAVMRLRFSLDETAALFFRSAGFATFDAALGEGDVPCVVRVRLRNALSERRHLPYVRHLATTFQAKLGTLIA